MSVDDPALPLAEDPALTLAEDPEKPLVIDHAISQVIVQADGEP